MIGTASPAYLIGLEAAASALEEELLEGAPRVDPVDDDWRTWAPTLWPRTFSEPWAPYHEEMWEWGWAIEVGRRPRPFVSIQARGWAKSTNAEGITVAVAARGRRQYGLYVRETQEQADKSVGNVAALMESRRFAEQYPQHAQRAIGKYGTSKGWRRNRLWTAGGFVLDALGLDGAVRGLKAEDRRPDWIVFDDIDGKEDSPKATEKKARQISHSILPAGTQDVAVLVVQNLITAHGIVSQLKAGTAGFLLDRIVSGPHPALEGAKYEQEQREDGTIRVRITEGRPTWPAKGIAVCEDEILKSGLRSFREECQHEVDEREGALWTRDTLDQTRVWEAPDLVRVVVGVDPSGGGDDIGIVLGGISRHGHAYIFADRTQPGRLGPLAWGEEAVRSYHVEQGDRIVAEKNFGGALVESNVQVAARAYAADEREEGNPCPDTVPVKMVNASRGKAVRAEPVAAEFEAGRAHIVGYLTALERELTTWVPGDLWSPNRLDAMVWVVTELLLTGKRRRGPPRGSRSYTSV